MARTGGTLAGRGERAKRKVKRECQGKVGARIRQRMQVPLITQRPQLSPSSLSFPRATGRCRPREEGDLLGQVLIQSPSGHLALGDLKHHSWLLWATLAFLSPLLRPRPPINITLSEWSRPRDLLFFSMQSSLLVTCVLSQSHLLVSAGVHAPHRTPHLLSRLPADTNLAA